MREEALDHAAALARRVAGEICAGGGQDPTVVIREGEPAGELRRLLEEDSGIGLVVLGAGSGRDGPGPLVTLLARAGGWGGRAVPVLVVPGALSTADVRALTPGPRPDAA
jgi:nucleotide-binding universal stress UspA family protein